MNSRFFTIPNILTLVRIACVPLFIVATIRGWYLAAFVLFVAAGITDAVDGYVARKLNQHSTIGAVLDPAADKTLMVSGYLLYTMYEPIRYRVPDWLTFTVFARDVLIVLFALLLYSRVRIKRFPPSIAGKISTICQIVALSVTIAANSVMQPVAVHLLWLVWRVALLMTLISGWDYMRRADANLRAA